MQLTIEKDEEIQKLQKQLTKTEENLKKYQTECKRLANEVQRLRFLVNEGNQSKKNLLSLTISIPIIIIITTI
jgi:peptidoglycan hydrolase CwlO-like protein